MPAAFSIDTLTLGPGAKYTFEVADASATPGVGTDTLEVLNTLIINAGNTGASRVTIDLDSLTNVPPPGDDPGWYSGNALNFDPSQKYHWLLSHASGGMTGFDPSRFVFDSSGFSNALDGGSFSVGESGNDLLLNFTPVPEPSVTGVTLLAFVWMTRCRRSAGSQRQALSKR